MAIILIVHQFIKFFQKIHVQGNRLGVASQTKNIYFPGGKGPVLAGVPSAIANIIENNFGSMSAIKKGS